VLKTCCKKPASSASIEPGSFFDRHHWSACIVQTLGREAVGIHRSKLSELVALSAGVISDAIASLAIPDPRLRYNRSEDLYLPARDRPRRQSIDEAVATVRHSTPEPITIDEIAPRAWSVLGRPCERSTISRVLQQLSAERLMDGI